MTMVNAYAGRELPAEDAALLARRQAALGPAYRLFYERPLHIVRGEGVWLFDAAGNRYLDAYNNVASVGHAHPAVVEAIYEQAQALNTHTRYLSEPVVAYAERLLGRFPPGLDTAMFTCSGSEANDLALRMARAVTGAAGLIVTENAYHGVTIAIAEASPSLGPGNTLGAAVVTIPPPREGAEAFARAVEDAIAELGRRGLRPAALMVDTLFSSDGIYPDPVGLLAPAVARIWGAGGLFIADEVQAGFARTGPSFWGFARHGVSPDIVTLGKPMGNGHPVAGLVARRDLTQAFGEKVRYFNTFGGNPVSAAAADAVLRVIEREGLAENAAVVGEYLRQGLAGLKIGPVRDAGLYLGVQLRDGATAAFVVNHMRDAGVLLSATGPLGNVLKLRPPLVLKHAEADLIVEAVANAATAAPQ